LYIVFYDDSSNQISSQASITFYQGEWHHLAFTWDIYNTLGNGQNTDIFVDGSNSSTSSGGTFDSPGSGFISNLHIGSDRNGDYQESSVFDELRISDRVLTENEIVDSYNKGMADHRNESVNWTIYNVTDGSYTWACLAYDNESQMDWSSNYTLYIDASSNPSLNSVIFDPADADGIDPGVNISVFANLTDISNVSHVILQWKETGNWNNDSMDYNNVTELFENAIITGSGLMTPMAIPDFQTLTISAPYGITRGIRHRPPSGPSTDSLAVRTAMSEP
jgi:hypothetical protein